jgi:hypothetical protein
VGFGLNDYTKLTLGGARQPPVRGYISETIITDIHLFLILLTYYIHPAGLFDKQAVFEDT